MCHSWWLNKDCVCSQMLHVLRVCRCCLISLPLVLADTVWILESYVIECSSDDWTSTMRDLWEISVTIHRRSNYSERGISCNFFLFCKSYELSKSVFNQISAIIVSHTWMIHVSHLWMIYVSHIWMSYVVHIWMSQLSHIWISYLSHVWMNFMSHTWMSYDMCHKYAEYQYMEWISTSATFTLNRLIERSITFRGSFESIWWQGP